MTKLNMTDIKTTIRNPYAWPGGYPLYFITADGAALSIKAARDNFKAIVWAWMNDANDGWLIEAYDVNWEDSDLTCDHTGEKIESAYGD